MPAFRNLLPFRQKRLQNTRGLVQQLAVPILPTIALKDAQRKRTAYDVQSQEFNWLTDNSDGT
eukprot:3327183-Amphidinium_carterae.1